MKSWIHKLAIPGALIAGMGTTALGVEVIRTSFPNAGAQQNTTPAPAVVVPAAAQSGAALLGTAFRAASQAAFPGVVYIRVETMAQQVSNNAPEQFRGAPFGQFFGAPGTPAPREPALASGSGFIMSPDGYILTNNHVVSRASRVTVTLPDKREFTARVVGRDPNTDVAVIKVDARDLPVVKLGTADDLQTGDWVLALGYPLSLGQTTTAGIVSAKGKSLGIVDQNEGATRPLEHFIQTDAVINPGNSGGPLVNLRGEVVGVNSAIASPTGYYSGYGFAVPIDLARRVADDLIRYGNVHRPLIGVQIRDVTAADREVFRLERAAGTVVAQDPTGPARAAGLELGDVIVAADGRPVEDTGDLMERVARKQPGDKLSLQVVRYGERRGVEIRLGTMQAPPSRDDARDTPPAREEMGAAQLGLRVQNIDAASARQLGLGNGGGLIVTGVDPMGPASGQVPEGFRIERVNGQQVSTAAQLRATIAKLRPGQVVSLFGRSKDGSGAFANFRLRE